MGLEGDVRMPAEGGCVMGKRVGGGGNDQFLCTDTARVNERCT